MAEILKTKTCEEIMTTVYKPMRFVVDKLIAQGLYILAGAPKVGKSWLALDLCLSIAKGTKALGRQTIKATALYLCLEDSYVRIQNRLYEITDEPTDDLHFAVMSDKIGEGLEQQIEKFSSLHPNLSIVFIDTLQMVRSDAESSYGSDYKELTALKKLAAKLGIAVVLIHHTRKCSDSDPFNMISGSTGLSGCVDGSMVLIENRRGSRNAKLYCVGRDIENCEMNLQFDGAAKRWRLTDDAAEPQSKDNVLLAAVYVFMKEHIHYEGTATELAKSLEEKCAGEFYPNRITRDLVQNGYKLKEYGIYFKYKRMHDVRKIILHYYPEQDGSKSTAVVCQSSCKQ